ncbi:porin [Psychrobacter cryohalolentis]|uniref:Porin, Gram-negative type n=1 Tax=Psychrobacter cryohalolentis (strain ATCC BAA-1226 / DSM 17306 / VKM B-2378 / K5) TaxID=335284 RepID=Q1Q9J9_PSYCK|nr:porin [Psychrobacter cryohalolentis]ABE75654.1 porin, Gram-negative type [Psychrobacter cryohalolentis K5]ASE25844.1 porin [Psychrobacter cryohalolentis]
MKKLLLATAIAALSVSAANAAPTVYGKAFVAMDYVNAEFDGPAGNMYDEDTVEINSHASRLGFKGSEAMTANTDVIYQLEYGTKVDGDKNGFTNRDTFLGVNNKQFGEFRVGKNQSTLARIDNVVVNQGYFDNLGTTQNENEVVEALNMADSNRIASSIIWTAPKYNGLPLQLSAMYSSDDVNGNDNSGFGVAMLFDQGTGFTAGVAYDKDQNILGDIIRGTATVDLSKFIAAPVTLGALYQVADYDGLDRNGKITGAEKEKGLVISAEMPLANFARPASIYTQYNKTDNLNGFDNADSDQIVVGGKYMYKDNIIAHAYAGMNKADNVNYAYKATPNATSYTNVRGDAEVFVIGTGLEYKF